MPGKKILVVDDEEDVVTFLTVFLEDHGYVVCSTTNSSQVLALAQKERPDLITLDLLMPDLSGKKLYGMLKQDAKLAHVPVVIITATDLFGDMFTQRDIAPPAALIDKPISKTLLLETIQEILA